MKIQIVDPRFAQFGFLEKCLRVLSPPHFMDDFLEKCL